MDSILIRMPNWLGDMVMALPVIEDVATRFPHAKITVQTPPAFKALLVNNPYVTATLHEAKGKFECGILLTNSFSSAWKCFRQGVKRRVGFANECRSFLLTDAVPFPKEKGKEHLVRTYKRLLAPFAMPLSDTAPTLYLGEDEKKKKFPGLVIGFNCGAAFGPAKCWLADRFRSVALQLLKKEKRTLVFFGSQDQRGLIDEITEGIPCVNLVGKTTLRELVGHIGGCDLFLTNDSGPMHLAAALKVPLVALFGSTNPQATGPYGHGKVIQKKVSCSPCYLRHCPIDFRCMKSIEVDEVVKELEELLSSQLDYSLVHR